MRKLRVCPKCGADTSERGLISCRKCGEFISKPGVFEGWNGYLLWTGLISVLATLGWMLFEWAKR
jgi:hypothetical protein